MNQNFPVTVHERSELMRPLDNTKAIFRCNDGVTHVGPFCDKRSGFYSIEGGGAPYFIGIENVQTWCDAEQILPSMF